MDYDGTPKACLSKMIFLAEAPPAFLPSFLPVSHQRATSLVWSSLLALTPPYIQYSWAFGLILGRDEERQYILPPTPRSWCLNRNARREQTHMHSDSYSDRRQVAGLDRVAALTGTPRMASSSPRAAAPSARGLASQRGQQEKQGNECCERRMKGNVRPNEDKPARVCACRFHFIITGRFCQETNRWPQNASLCMPACSHMLSARLPACRRGTTGVGTPRPTHTHWCPHGCPRYCCLVLLPCVRLDSSAQGQPAASRKGPPSPRNAGDAGDEMEPDTTPACTIDDYYMFLKSSTCVLVLEE
jgi:hypothetical protein